MLIICGLEVVHTSWDGELLRTRLMDALRSFVSPIAWFCAGHWPPEDRGAVGNILGEGKLTVSQDASCTAALVRDYFAKPGDPYARALMQWASGSLPAQEEERWAGDWRRVISSLRSDPEGIRKAISPLIEAPPGQPDKGLLERAVRTEEENRQLAPQSVEEIVQVGDKKLVPVNIPREKHSFWREISEYARLNAAADFSLCRLAGRSVLILNRGKEPRVDLRVWARYLTDMTPAANAIGERPDAVPIFVRGLTEDPGLKQEAIRILVEGAHLLAG